MELGRRNKTGRLFMTMIQTQTQNAVGDKTSAQRRLQVHFSIRFKLNTIMNQFGIDEIR